jgi:hypothetical protein
MMNIQMKGKTNTLRFSTQPGQGKGSIPLIMRIGARKVSGIHMKMKVGTWTVNA